MHAQSFLFDLRSPPFNRGTSKAIASLFNDKNKLVLGLDTAQEIEELKRVECGWDFKTADGMVTCVSRLFA